MAPEGRYTTAAAKPAMVSLSSQPNIQKQWLLLYSCLITMIVVPDTQNGILFFSLLFPLLYWNWLCENRFTAPRTVIRKKRWSNLEEYCLVPPRNFRYWLYLGCSFHAALPHNGEIDRAIKHLKGKSFFFPKGRHTSGNWKCVPSGK